jgi:limonene-1,2-epoxide hydrolase
VTPEETVEAFIAAFTSGDPARAAKLAADDIVYDNIGLAPTAFQSIVPTINGRQAMLEFLAPLQDVEWVIHHQMSSGNLVINERRDKMSFGGAQMEWPCSGCLRSSMASSRFGVTTATRRRSSHSYLGPDRRQHRPAATTGVRRAATRHSFRATGSPSRGREGITASAGVSPMSLP